MSQRKDVNIEVPTALGLASMLPPSIETVKTIEKGIKNLSF